MICPNCRHDNPEDARFCNACGSQLDMVCPQCGKANPPGSRFCNGCGRELTETREAPPVDYTQPQSYTPKHLADKILTTRSAIEGERKLVTVFFADVAGYTSMSENLDPEEVHQIMDGCFKILMDEIHRYEGTINQFTGDGVMALFGAPVAHEDHAQRACHAALSIQRAIGEYGDKIKQDTEVDFRMRIGLNSGPVIVGSIGDDLRMDYTAVGDTTNMAARMESVADPGAVMISSNTHRLVRDFFEIESLGKVEVKGKEEPQEAFRLIRAGEVETRISASVVKGLTRFVGRKNSMGALLDAYERAKGGSGQVVGVVGEAGVGKSRLLLEMRNRVPPDEYTYLEGRCLHFGGSMAYLPILDILRAYFEIQEGDREFIIKQKIRDKVTELDSSLTTAIPPFQEILSLKVDDEQHLKMDPQMKRIVTFEALRDVLIRESHRKPLVLAIEDLHWIDRTSEECLDYLIGWIANAPILLILLYRPEYTHQWGSKSYYSKVGVDQLGTESSTALVAAMLEEGEVAPELRDIILNRAAGNPLFMEEFTHTLLENGTIEKKDNKYVLTRDLSDIQVPDTIQGIIAARMDRLEDNLKRTMQVASVIGRDFVFRILQAITGMREELKSYLLNLQGLEFIYEKALFPELEYIFKHALTQEVAYNSLLQRRRKEIHERIGQAIEEIYADRLEEFYGMLAYHYGKAEDLEKTVRFSELAAQRAMSVYAFEEAVQLLEQAVHTQNKLNPSDKAKRCDLLLALGDALIMAGEPRRVLDKEALEAFALAESMNDDSRASRVCHTATIALNYYGWGMAFSSPEVKEWAKRADIYAQPDSKERVWADISLGAILYDIKAPKDVNRLNQALDLARRIGDPETFWQAAHFWMFWVWMPKYAEKQRHLADEMMTYNRVGLSIRTLIEGLFWTSVMYNAWGERQRCEEIYHELRPLIKRTGQPNHEIMDMTSQMNSLIWDGRLEEALETSYRLERYGEEHDLTEFTANAIRSSRPRVNIFLGRYSSIPFRAPQVFKHEVSSPNRILDFAYNGRVKEVKAMLNALVMERADIIHTEEDTYPIWRDILHLEAAIVIRYREAIELLMGRLANNQNVIPISVWNTTCTSRHLGAAAAMLGRPDEARSHYRDALKVATDTRFRPEIALTRIQLAELLLVHYPRDREEAIEHLDFAIEEFREMKMAPSLEKQRHSVRRCKEAFLSGGIRCNSLFDEEIESMG